MTGGKVLLPSVHLSNFPSPLQSAASAYASTGGHTHTRFRSPYAPSTRPTDGHTLCWRVQTAGDAPRPRGEGRAPAPGDPASGVWGGPGGRLFAARWFPRSSSRISPPVGRG